MKQLKAKITFTIDKDHSDFKYVNDETKELYFEDTYIDRNNYYDTIEQLKSYAKSDLMLVAGGGYSTNHIHNVRFEFN